MANGKDPIIEALEKGTLSAPTYNQTNLASARMTAFPFKKLGKYDRGITSAIYEGSLDADPLKLQEYYRGEMQSGAKKLLNGIVSRGLSVGTKVGQGLGHVLGTGAAVLSGDVFKGDWSLAYDNMFAEAFANMDEGLKEAFPVHLSQQYGEGNLIAKMGTATFWATDFADGLAFLGSAYVPGMAIGGLGKTFSGASKLKMLQGLKNAGLTTQNVTVGASTIYNTISEAGVEAYHVNKDLRQQLIQAGVPEEEARMRAGEAAAETFGLNIATLWAPNVLQAKWFHGPINNRHNLLKQAVKNGELATGEVASKYQWWKSALKGLASEGLWEENIQTAIERYEKRFANRETDAGWLSGVASEGWTNIRGFLKTISPFHDAPAAGSPEDEGATAIALGALIGAPMSAYAEFGEYTTERDELKTIQSWWDQSLKYTGMGLKAFADDVKALYKEFSKEVIDKDADGNEIKKIVKTYLNAQNRTEVDPNKMANFMMRLLANKKFFDESVIAAIKNDALHDNFNKHLAFASFVHSLYSNPNLAEEDIIQVIDQAVKASKETDELGVTEFIRDNMKLAESYYRDLQQIESQISGEYDFKEDPAAQSFKRNLRKSLLYAKVKQRVADEIASTADSESLRSAAENISKDAQEFIDGAAKNRQNIWKAYSKFYNEYMEATKQEENLDDQKAYQKKYWASELANTLSIDKVDHPEFWSAEPLTANRDARKTATAEYTLFEENAANRGAMYMTNQAIKDGIDQEIDPSQIADQLTKVPEILDSTKEKAKQVISKLDNEISELTEERDTKEEIYFSIEDGLADAYLDGVLGPNWTNDQAAQHAMEIAQELDNLNQQISEKAATSQQIQDALASPKKLVPNKKPLQIQFLERELGPADRLIEAHKRNPKEFAQLQQVLREINRVNYLIDFFENRKDLKKSIKDRALVLLQQRLNKLQEAEKTAAENVNNKARVGLIKEQQKVRSLTSGLLEADNALTQLIKDSVDFDTWKTLNEEYKKSDGIPYTNTYASLLSLIDELRSSDNKNEIINKIKEVRKQLIKDLGGITGALSTTMDSYERSPHQWIYTIVSNFVNRTQNLSQVFKNTSLPFYQWKKSNDIYEFRDAIENMDGMSDVFMITTYHSTISAMQTILDYLQSDVSYKEIFETVNKSIDTLTPSLEQVMASTEIVGALTTSLTGGLYDDAVYLRGPAGSGKALPNYVEVYNEEGPIQIGDIKIGDTIFGKNGLTKVIGVYPQGKKKVVELVFSDGRIVECCEDHLWDFYINRVGGCNTTTLPTKYIDPSKNEFFLPQYNAVKFSKKELPLPPYLLGLLLGDGCLKNGSISLSTADKEIVDYLFKVTKNTNITPKHISNYDWRLTSPRGESNYILEAIKDLELRVNSHNKFIPKEYLLSSIEDRIELLKGLMDTDGTVDKRYGSTEYYTTSKQLAKDFQFLLNSLGVNGSIGTKETTHKLCYRVKPTFLDFCPFKLSRKAKYFKKTEWPRHIKLVSVNYTDREEEMTCIKVDAKDQLFLVDQFILTHNTTVTANLVLKAFMKLTGTSKDQILVSGHTNLSADKIASELDMKATYLDQLLATDLTKYKLVIIDEAAGLGPVQANAVMQKIKDHNEANKDKVRVFLLGDPSQITRQSIPVALQSGHVVEPITTVFRTSVGAIETAFMEFKDNPDEVTGITVQSSHTLLEAKSNNQSLFGVMTGGALDMIDVVKARAQGDGRRRVIIVNNQQSKAPYEGIPGVEVMTYEEAQGQTIDEVYVDIQRSKSNFDNQAFEDDLEYNTALYVAMSRAKYFVYTTANGLTSVKSDSVTQTTSTDSDIFEAIKEQYGDYFNAHQYFFEEFNNNPIEVTKEKPEEDVAVAEEDIKDEVPSDDSDTVIPTPEEKEEAEEFPQKEDKEEVTPLETGEVVYSNYLHYPDNTAIGSWVNDPTYQGPRFTGNGYVIKSPSSNDYGYTLSVIAEREDGTFDVVAQLSNKDFTDGAFGQALTNEWNKKWKDSNHPLSEAQGGNTTNKPITSKKVGLVPGQDFNLDLVVMPVTVDKVQPLEVVIDPKKRFRDMGVDPDGVDFLERLLTEVYRNIFKGSKLGANPAESTLIPAENGYVSLDRLTKKANNQPNDIRIEIFSDKTADEIAKRSRFRPKPGRAYLVVENMAPEGSQRASNPFFIPLANLPFSKNSYYYQPLKDFYDALTVVEQTLGLQLGAQEGTLEDIIREVAHQNFKGTWNQQEEKYEILANDKPKTAGEILANVPRGAAIDPEALASVFDQIETLIRLGFGVQWRYLTMTKEEYDASEYANNDLYVWKQQTDKDGNPKDLGQVRQKTIDAATGQDTIDEKNFPREYVLVANQGKAQRALDELARENEFIGDERLRIAVKGKRQQSKLYIMSRTLFRKKDQDEYAYMYGIFRQRYLAATGKKLTGYSGEAVKKIVLDEGIITQDELQAYEQGHYTPPVTSKMLGDIVNFEGQYHSAPSKQGQRYLREPLSNMMDFNIKFGNNLQSAKARAVIYEKLASKVLTVNPLSVKISIKSDPVDAAPSSYGVPRSSIGSPLNEKMFIPKDPVKQAKEKVKKAKNKNGWIKRDELDTLLGDIAEAIDLSEAVTKVTDKSVKIDEEKIKEAPAPIVEYTPTVGKELVTEEELIAGIKSISPQAWKEVSEVVKGKSDSERLSILSKLYTAINPDLNDDVRYAFDQERMQSIVKALGKELTEQEAKNLLSRLLPGMQLTPEQVRFVSKEVLQSMAQPGEDLWGLWDRGIMYFTYTERNGMPVFYENVIRHEVFHRVHQVHMTQEERDNLRKLVDDHYGTSNLTNYEYEEWLARHYQSWRSDSFKARGFLNKWFKWLQRLFDWIFSNRNELERLFNKIDYGFFTQETYRDTAHASRQAMKFIKEDFKKMDVFKEAVNIVRKGFNRYLYIDPKLGGGKDGLVVSEVEALSFLRRDLDESLASRIEQLKNAEETMKIFPKGSAMHQLAANKIVGLNLRIGALRVLTTTPEKGKSPFSNLIDYLYPNIIYLDELSDQEARDAKEDPAKSLEEVLEPKNDTKTGVAAQIEENETKNHELKLSSSMKHWLSSIMRKSEEVDKQGRKIVLDIPVSDRFAYFQMLQFFQTLDLNGIDYELRDIYEQKRYIEKNSSMGNASKMVLERLMQTIEEAVSRTYGENNKALPIDQNIVLHFNELTGKTTFYFIQGPEASRYTFYDEIKDNGQINVHELHGERLIPIYNDLRRKGLMESKDLFNALYKRTIARDIIRTAQNNFRMKEMEIMIASQQSDFGKTYARYIKGRTLGIHTSLRSSFKDALYEYVAAGLHMQPAYEKIDNLIKAGNHMEAIKTFLNQLGLGFLAKDFQTGNVETIAKNIQETMNAAIAGKIDGEWIQRTVTDPVSKEEETILVDQVQEWLDDNETIVNDFVESLKFNFEWLRNTSVRSGDNKKLYKFSNSSYMHDLVFNLLNSSEFAGSNGNQKFRKVPEYLKTTFFRYNPFVAGLSKLYEMNYHDTFRNEFTQSTRSYDRENKAEWLRREFTFGFLGGLASSKQLAQSYYQFSYPLADRTRIPVFRTKFLSQEEAKDAIKMAVTQIRSRNRNLNFFKGYNTDDNTNFEVYSPELFNVKDFKALHKIPIDKVVNAIFNKLMTMGEQTAKTLIEEEILIPSDVNKALDKARKKWKDLPSVEEGIKYRSQGEYRIKEEFVKEIAQAFEVNSYLNSYFIHQLFAGDQAFYKDSVDVVKRAAGPSAPGTAPLVNDEFGMKKKAKIAIIKDKSIPFIGKEAQATKDRIRETLKEIGQGTREITDLKYLDKVLKEQKLNFEELVYETLVEAPRKIVANAEDLGTEIYVSESLVDAVYQESIDQQPSIVKFLRQFLNEEEFEQVKNYFSRKGFDMTDAQGFVTPERMNDIKRGFGRAYGLGNIMKPVYFAMQTMNVIYGNNSYDTKEQAEDAIKTYGRDDLFIDQDPSNPEKFRLFTKEAYPIYLKYSSVNLSDELIEQFPFLNTVRQKMRDASIDELIFESGVKVGKPVLLTSAEEVESPHVGTFAFSNTLEIDNEHFRMQLNPRHDPDDRVSMFTQLTYFLNVFDVDSKTSNDEVARSVYNALAFLVKKGLDNFNRRSRRPVGLAKQLLNTPGYETALELLDAGVSIDNPAIEKLLVTQYAAKLSNDTVGRIKFPGGKYTLQSAYGIYKNKIKTGTLPTEADELQYHVNKDGSLYAEMILPKGVLSPQQEAAVMRGDDLFLHGDGFAFRIPSTELHSAISIKVVGIYDDLKTNVIIGPKELVPLHGSDFDADSLSVILRTRAKTFFNFGDIKIRENEFIGYKSTKKGLVLDDEFPQKISDTIALAKKLKSPKSIINVLEKLEDDYVKNVIAEAMMEVIRHPRNRPRMLTPISMERFNGIYGGESMKTLLKEAGDPDPQRVYDISSTEGRYMAYKSIFDGAALTGVFANGIKALAYMIKSGPSGRQQELRNQIKGFKQLLKDTKKQDEEARQALQEKIDKLENELEDSYFDQQKNLPSIKEQFRVTFDGQLYTGFSEMERRLNNPSRFSKTSIWETMDALVNSAIDNAKEQILFMIGANGITANALTAMLGMGVPLKTSVFLMRQPIIMALGQSKYRGRAENGIADLREKLQKVMKEEPSSTDLSTEELSKHIFSSDYKIDWENMTSKDAEHYWKVLDQFEKVWQIGKSLETISAYLNIVREMPVTAETIGKMRETIDEIGEFDIFVDLVDRYTDFKNTGSEGSLTTNESFAIELPNFIKNNPHIAVAHQAFERLEEFISDVFFVHSPVIKEFIKSLELTGQIALAQGDRDSAILNRIEFAREFQKYLMSTIYKEKFEGDKVPKYYYTNYKGEQEYLEGSKAWFQHFINKVEALQKFLREKAGENDKLTNYFLFNLSISGNEIRSIRYTAGSNLKYEDIILARDAFEELNKYEITEHVVDGRNPTYTIKEKAVFNMAEIIDTAATIDGIVNENKITRSVVTNFTDLQRDFIIFSILNNGLQYSITSLSQVLPPQLFVESDVALQQISSLVKGSEQARDNIRDHFKISMVAANAEQLSWVPRQGEQSELFLQEEKQRFVQLKGNVIKPLIDTAGSYKGAYYDLAFENKVKEKSDAAKVFPRYIRTSEGRSAVAYLRMNEPQSDIVMYQRIGKNPSGFYAIADLSESYNIGRYFNLSIPTIHASGVNNSIITVDRSLDYIPENSVVAIVDVRDITRENRRFVKIVGQLPRQENQQFKYQVVDAFEDSNQENQYINDILAKDELKETYTVEVFDEWGILKTEENEVVDAPNNIAKHVIGKSIDEASKYIKENKGKIKLLTKRC